MGKYKKLYGTLLLGLIAIIILLTAVFSYSRSIEESYKEENINSLKELSNQGALMLHNEIKNKLLIGAKLALNDGVSFGSNGNKYFRLNLALSQKALEIALNQLSKEFI